jgi:hypothetical protein
MDVVYAPNRNLNGPRPRIFLAGSIEMGKAEDWQAVVTTSLKDLQCTVLNPRRPDWDSSWTQEMSNPQFREQVEWELSRLEIANIIVMYFAPGTMSPISLMELGLHVASGKVIVCCPPTFWRKGNVDITCARHRVRVYDNLDDMILRLKSKIGDFHRGIY